jgi:uridine kinase
VQDSNSDPSPNLSPPSSISFARSFPRSIDPSRKVRVTLDEQPMHVPYGTPVGDLLEQHTVEGDLPVLAAVVHHRCVDLTHPLCAPTRVLPITYANREGVLVYRRTASLLLLEAARQLFGNTRVSIGQALGNGYFYRIHIDGDLSKEQVSMLEQRMREFVDSNLPLTTETVSIAEAREQFESLGLKDKLRLLQTHWEPFVTLVRCGQFCDLHHYPVAPNAGLIPSFSLVHYPPGLILRFPPRGKLKPISQYRDTPKLFQAYQETREWNRIAGVEDVGQLNDLVIRGEAAEVIRIGEGLHEKKIADIADRITHAPQPIKLVLIAGPSASGKTTFAKRLSLQLRVNGIRPVSLSMDNFYVNREDTPRDSDGEYDFESIEAIDLALFNEVLAKLLKGERVLTPKFDFPSGKRVPMDRWFPLQLEKGQVLVVEGIHGLNDRLTESVAPERKYKVYVSALTQLCIDDHNRIFTSDTRFLRRIVRDRMFRGYPAATTIENWSRVRRGELRNIFPFQEKANVMFNSALVYEQAVLRLFAERFLLEVPQDHPSFSSAYRLLKFVQNFVPIFEPSVPQISLLREFVGGSGFKY